MMPERSLEGRVSGNIAGQPDGFGVKIGRDRHLSTLSLFKDRPEIKVFLQSCLAALMDASHRCANLIIGVRVEILLKKIDQSAFPLQNAQASAKHFG